MSPVPDRVLVLGLARSGRAAVAALRHVGRRGGRARRERGLETEGVDAEVRLGPWEDELLEGVGLAVKSPGIPAQAPPVRAARERAIPVVSEIELGARLLPNRIVGITGTNGKTTTTALTGAMFEAAGIPVEVAGNIGRPLTSIVVSADRDAWVICELSSFQLEDVETLRPAVAVLLNLEPDHLDRHGSFDAYRDAKLRVFENQGPDDVAVVPHGFADVPGLARRVEFTGADPLPAEPRIPGAHNRENAAAATAAARAAGVGDDAIAEALRTFPGVEHRIEDVGTVARRPLRERLEGHERRRRAARAGVLSGRTEARHPRRARQGGAVRTARGRVRPRRPCVPDRGGGGGDRGRARGSRRAVRAERRPRDGGDVGDA